MFPVYQKPNAIGIAVIQAVGLKPWVGRNFVLVLGKSQLALGFCHAILSILPLPWLMKHVVGEKISLISLKWVSVCVYRRFGMWSGSSSVWCQNGLTNLSYLGEERKASQFGWLWFSKVQQGVILFDLMKPFNLTWFKKLECKNSYLKFLIHCFLVFFDRMHSLSPWY